MGYFTIFELAIGVYLIICAVSGRGQLFENDRLKVPREQYVKVMRIMGAVTGGVLLVSNGLIMIKVIPDGGVISWVFWGIGFACILAMAIYSAKSTDKNAMRGTTAPSQDAPKKDPLRAAFVFDDEEDSNGGN